MSKIKTITIVVTRHLDPQSATGRRIAVYGVKQVTDSIKYLPGEPMTEDEVVLLCDDPGWKVSLVEAKT